MEVLRWDYLIRLRVIPFLTLFVLGITKVKRIAVIVFLIWTGFLMGIITSASIIQMGMLGILFNVLSLVPHFFFYVMGYIILLLNIRQRLRTICRYMQAPRHPRPMTAKA